MNKEIIATPDSPLHLSDRHTAANYSGTLDYIPGSAIRGAVASGYLQRVELQQDIDRRLQGMDLSFRDYFDWLFLSGQVRFPNLYPMKTQRRPLVIPLSARSCKRFSGFSNGPRRVGEEQHGVRDILLNEPEDFRCRERLRERGRTTCGAPMEQLVGFYESDNGEVNGSQQVKITPRLLTRTGIENETENVRQGVLFSLEAMEEGGGSFGVFVGNLIASPPSGWISSAAQEAIQILEEHLYGNVPTGERSNRRRASENFQTDECGPFSRLWVGEAKTRGIGALRIELSELGPPDLLPPLEERLNRLQEVWEQLPEHEDTTIFTLTFNSDAIVMDELWQYRSVLDEEVLEREAPGAPPCCLKRLFTRTRIVSGWNSAHRLPKEDELAILKGAAFLYHTTADQATLLSWLQRIEEEGIGERRSEGFGQIIACHPFHWEVAQ